MSEKLSGIVFLGETGVGKSSLGNALAGVHPSYHTDRIIFPMSCETTACTITPVSVKVEWLGSGAPTLFIDTPGLNDAQATDCHTVNPVVQIIHKHSEVNVLAIVLNAKSPRLSASCQTMLEEFQWRFGETFWNSTVFIVNHWSYDKRSIRQRSCDPNNTEDKFSRNFLDVIKQEGLNIETDVPFLFIDSHYEPDNDDEMSHFNSGARKLKGLLEKNFPFEIKFRLVMNIRNSVANLYDDISNLIRNHTGKCVVFVAVATSAVVAVIVLQAGVPVVVYQAGGLGGSTVSKLSQISASALKNEVFKRRAQLLVFAGLRRFGVFLCHRLLPDGLNIILEEGSYEAYLPFKPQDGPTMFAQEVLDSLQSEAMPEAVKALGAGIQSISLKK